MYYFSNKVQDNMASKFGLMFVPFGELERALQTIELED